MRFIARRAVLSRREFVDEAWYAVYTRFQHEKSAANLLERKDVTVFLPVYRAVHFWGNRNQVVVLPLFPCYLFVKTAVERKLDVLRTAGVRWLVESAGRACEVAETEVEALRKVCASGARLEPHPYLRQGDHVRIRRGPLAGTEGFFVRARNLHRVVVSVELLRKGVSVEVEAGNVERVATARANPPMPAAVTQHSA